MKSELSDEARREIENYIYARGWINEPSHQWDAYDYGFNDGLRWVLKREE